MMAAADKLVPHERAVAVIEALGEAYNHRQFNAYANIVYSLPLLLHQHGLGQTLAYLQLQGGGRPDSPSMLLFRQLTRRLAQLYPVAGDDLLAHLAQVDSAQYRQLAEEAGEFALTLRQALWAQEEEDEEGGQRP